MTELDEYLAFGLDVLARCGTIAAAAFRRPQDVRNKAGEGFDPVTDADRRVEAAIRERVAARFPSHGIRGEEFGESPGSSAWQWLIDPIDGTRAYLAGLPVWGCLLGLLRDGEPVCGWMRQPVIGETFFGDGARAWLLQAGESKRPIRVRADATMVDATLAATHPGMFDVEGGARFGRLAARVRLTRFGGECYNYCLLAHGLIDLVVEDDLAPHDILPLVPIVRGAGGVVSDMAGRTPRGGMVVAAANAAIHDAALRMMRD